MTTPNQIIETENLILRPPVKEDMEAYIAFYSSDRAALVGGDGTTGRAWRIFATLLGQWQIQGQGLFTVTDKGNDTPIGAIGGFYPAGWPERELGWAVFAGAEGRSIAFEAAEAARRHAYQVWGWDGAVSYIDPVNLRSIALAERLGCTHDPKATAPDFGTPLLVYRHPAPKDLA